MRESGGYTCTHGDCAANECNTWLAPASESSKHVTACAASFVRAFYYDKGDQIAAGIIGCVIIRHLRSYMTSTSRLMSVASGISGMPPWEHCCRAGVHYVVPAVFDIKHPMPVIMRSIPECHGRTSDGRHWLEREWHGTGAHYRRLVLQPSWNTTMVLFKRLEPARSRAPGLVWPSSRRLQNRSALSDSCI